MVITLTRAATAMATATETDQRWRIGALIALIGAAIFAPLAWGSVTAGAEQVLWGILVLACVLGLPGYVFARGGEGILADCRSLPLVLWGVAVAMVWMSFFNARSYYDELVWQFIPLADHKAFLPGDQRRCRDIARGDSHHRDGGRICSSAASYA